VGFEVLVLLRSHIPLCLPVCHCVCLSACLCVCLFVSFFVCLFVLLFSPLSLGNSSSKYAQTKTFPFYFTFHAAAATKGTFTPLLLRFYLVFSVDCLSTSQVFRNLQHGILAVVTQVFVSLDDFDMEFKYPFYSTFLRGGYCKNTGKCKFSYLAVEGLITNPHDRQTILRR
jgi:hypothetical protein